jgi:hypothetical protein
VGALVELLREATGFVVDGRLARDAARLGRLVTLGHLPLGEGLGLRLIALPANPAYGPLWDVAAHGMLGALALGVPGELAQARRVAAAAVQIRSRNARPIVPAVLVASEGSAQDPAVDALAAAAESAPVFLPRALFERLLP